MSRWRLCPEQRHAEVWRVGINDGKGSVSCPSPPPSWRQVYGRLHESCRVPTGALSPVHLVIGKTIQQVLFVCEGKSPRARRSIFSRIRAYGSVGYFFVLLL